MLQQSNFAYLLVKENEVHLDEYVCELQKWPDDGEDVVLAAGSLEEHLHHHTHLDPGVDHRANPEDHATYPQVETAVQCSGPRYLIHLATPDQI